jgi:hypothetical protein
MSRRRRIGFTTLSSLQTDPPPSRPVGPSKVLTIFQPFYSEATLPLTEVMEIYILNYERIVRFL